MLSTANKIRGRLDWIFASVTSLGLIYVFVKYLWPLMSKRSWVIVFLVLVVVGLLLLQAILKKQYERLASKANWLSKKAWFNTHKLGLMLGQVTQLFDCLDQGHQLSIDSLKRLDAYIRRTIQDCYPADWGDRQRAYYGGWEAMPDDSVQAQQEWLGNHSARLRKLIVEEEPAVLD